MFFSASIFLLPFQKPFSSGKKLTRNQVRIKKNYKVFDGFLKLIAAFSGIVLHSTPFCVHWLKRFGSTELPYADQFELFSYLNIAH